MTWQVVRLADVVPTPWKNGGGTTRELVAWPDAEHWIWRMSVAEVAQSGPFSRFDGVQRWFAVLGGAGVTLTHNGTCHPLNVESTPFCFDGGGLTHCELVDGATQDFNLMVRVAGDFRNAGEARQVGAVGSMARVSGSASVNFNTLSNTIKIVAVYAISSWVNVRFNGEKAGFEPHSLFWRSAAAHDVIQVEGNDALLIEIEMALVPWGPITNARQNPAATDSRSA